MRAPPNRKSRPWPFCQGIQRNIRLCLLTLVVGVLFLPPAHATSAKAGLLPDNQSERLPVGSIPERHKKTIVNADTSSQTFTLSPPAPPSVTDIGVFRPQTFTLNNGLALVVIPNHRAPIISHMVWYQVGAADEPTGKSGLAHLLEHLMFKGTPAIPDGVFSRTIAANGGEDNAFTSWDYTVFYQNIAKDRLELVMQMEADRMNNLTLSEEQVETEKQVVLAERQQTTENRPERRLTEAMRATEFVSHPYGRPIIGWENDIAALKQEDVLAFYRTWYTPSNAIVVISGDVTPEDVRKIAENTYGQLPSRTVPLRKRLNEPDIEAERRIILRDESVSQPLFIRTYRAPSWSKGEEKQIVPLQVLAEILGGGTTSRLYRRLVVDLRLATAVAFDFDPLARDYASASVTIVPAPNRDVTLAESALDAVIRDLLSNGLSEAELDRAKARLIDGAVFSRDSVTSPARIFGATLSTGGDVSDIEEWPKRVISVSAQDIMDAAQSLFRQKGFVSGALLPERPIADRPRPNKDQSRTASLSEKSTKTKEP